MYRSLLREKLGVEGAVVITTIQVRCAIVQTRTLQLLSLLAMDKQNFTKDDIRAEKIKVFKRANLLMIWKTLPRGQYTPE